MQKNKRKVVIVGAGAVGSTFAYALAQQGVAEEICLIDINPDLVRGQVMDLVHGLPYYPPVNIKVGSPQDYADAAVIVITAGAAQKKGESRLDLAKKNAGIVENIIDDIKASGSGAVILMTTNPVDVLTYHTWKYSGWPKNRVIGSGTVLDSARLRYLISHHCNVDVHNVHAYICGEHGDSEFAAWSLSHIGGIPIDQYCPLCRECKDDRLQRENIEREVRDSAYHIIGYKGATWFAVGLAMVRITGAILRNQRSILTVSAVLEGEYGLTGLALGLPTLISGQGAEKIIDGRLSEYEREALSRSADIVRKTIEEIS
jgi:L-lactate dehydrogenase